MKSISLSQIEGFPKCVNIAKLGEGHKVMTQMQRCSSLMKTTKNPLIKLNENFLQITAQSIGLIVCTAIVQNYSNSITRLLLQKGDFRDKTISM